MSKRVFYRIVLTGFALVLLSACGNKADLLQPSQVPPEDRGRYIFKGSIPTREQLDSHGQFVKIAPYHQPRQCKKNIVGEEKPDGLFGFFTHKHAAIIQQRLPHGRRKLVVPAYPHHMAHCAHAHINIARQA